MNRPDQTRLAGALLAAVLWMPFGATGQESPIPDAEADVAAEEEPAEQADEAASGPGDLSATGDEWVDAQLVDIGRYARRYPETFADELQRYYDAPRASVVRLLGQGWEPGDLYFACALGSVTGRACRFVVDQRGNPPRVGWHALAEEMGAGPGSRAFARLKRGIVQSYARWARPLELDDEMSRAFPDHPRPAETDAGG